MRIAVIGPGLIGHSVALAIKRASATAEVIEIDRGDPIESAGGDLIVLAAPVDAIVDIIEQHAAQLRDSVIIDTGSTKRGILAAAREAGLDGFVGGHPMAGAAAAGATAAREDLFDGRPWFLVPHGARPDALQTAYEFVSRLGASPIVLDDDGSEHDRLMAAVSHVPQVVSSALMIVAAAHAGQQIGWAGSGLRDTTRLAQSSASMWQPILASNAHEIAPVLHELARLLDVTADQLQDARRVHDFFDKANRARLLL
jgi:prephenate dehydrogenase